MSQELPRENVSSTKPSEEQVSPGKEEEEIPQQDEYPSYMVHNYFQLLNHQLEYERRQSSSGGQGTVLMVQ